VRSVAQTLQQPTLQSAIPTLVPRDFLVKANGQIGSFNALSMVLAPTLGFLAYSHLSISSVMWIDIIGAIIGSTTVLLSIVPSFNGKSEVNSVFKDLTIGWRTMIGKPGPFQLAIIMAFMMVAFIPASSMYPLFTTEYFKMPLFHANLIETVFSLGMMVGGFAVGLFSGIQNRIYPILIAIIIMGSMFVISGVLPGNTFGFWIFFASNVLAGLCVPVMMSFTNSITQEAYPPEMLGRVMGVMMPMQSAAGPLGLMFAGPLAEQYGIAPLFLWGGVAVIVLAGIAYWLPAIRYIDRNRIMS
jgi:DHA3 family macrolide efflux protein-like MFS transporter